MARNGPRPGDYLPGPGAKRKNQGGWARVFVAQRPLVLEPKWPRVRYTYHYPEDVVTHRHPMLVMDCETHTRYAPVRSIYIWCSLFGVNDFVYSILCILFCVHYFVLDFKNDRFVIPFEY